MTEAISQPQNSLKNDSKQRALEDNTPFFEKWRSSVLAADGSRAALTCGHQQILLKQEKPELENVYDLFMHGYKMSKTAPCFGWKNAEQKFDTISYEDVAQHTQKLGRALRLVGALKQQDFVGLYSANSAQWMTTALTCALHSYVLVPLYDTLGAESTSFIINEVDMSVLFVDTETAAKKIFNTLKQSERDFKLKHIVLLGANGDMLKDPEPLSEDLLKLASDSKITLISLKDFLAKGSEINEESFVNKPPKFDDLYMVQYTSGTTGVPKGVMLSHGSFVSNISAVQHMYWNMGAKGYRVVDSGEHLTLAYLPLAHSYGQLSTICFLYNGGCTVYFSGNITNLAADAQLLKPTWMFLVPRLMNKVYTKVLAELETKGAIAKGIFWFAYARKLQLVRRGIITRSSIWDKLVFKKLQAKLGGRVKYMLSASAPIGPEVLEFWRVVFGAHLLEAYGQTECTALVTAAIHADGGNVGHPVACNKIKLADVPDMGLVGKSGRGEVCVKGYNVMKGYYKRPDLTAEVIDADGWLHTGDIGEFTSDGSLKLVDRKKHIFKLAQGEYIAPEKIESVYASCPLVAQVFVDGSGLQWFTVAVVVPDPVETQLWAEAQQLSDKDYKTVCSNKDFARHVLETLTALGKTKGLNSLEQIKTLHLHHEMFSVENDLLTPSMKNRRPQLRAYFKAQIDKMYADGPMLEQQKDVK